MINNKISFFQDPNKDLTVPADCKYIFINDFFSNDLLGGAEITTDSLISYFENQNQIYKINSHLANENFIVENLDKVFIVGNFSNLSVQSINKLVMFGKYVNIEYDYKFCKHRSIEKHKFVEKKECDCYTQNIGNIVSTFYSNSQHIFWMSEEQKNIYNSKFQNIKNFKNQTVLSSVFSKDTLEILSNLNKNREVLYNEFVVLGSDSWVKGKDASEQFCKINNIKYKILNNLSHENFLNEISKYEGLVYIPNGSDTCPRMIIEAKLIGLKIYINNFVQHANESWFNTSNLNLIKNYLEKKPLEFWNILSSIHAKHEKYTISGYTTTYNCIKNEYPFKESIESLNNFCDEIIVIDGGSSDGTWEYLLELSENNKKVKVFQNVLDWENESPAVLDGGQKALARSKCTSDFCWQIDVDELVHKNDVNKILKLTKSFPNHFDIMALPVIEFWGNKGKVRVDINPWKWRLSRNKDYITHGIPFELRYYNEDGKLLSKPGSDGCDMIDKNSFKRINFFCDFYNNNYANLLNNAICSEIDLKVAEKYLENLSNRYPCVYHLSWFDLSRKIKFYKNYWQNHWNKLYGLDASDTAEKNFMFDKPWSEVTEKDIEIRSEEFENNMGGWIFHRKWDGTKTNAARIKNMENINLVFNDINDIVNKNGK